MFSRPVDYSHRRSAVAKDPNAEIIERREEKRREEEEEGIFAATVIIISLSDAQ